MSGEEKDIPLAELPNLVILPILDDLPGIINGRAPAPLGPAGQFILEKLDETADKLLDIYGPFSTVMPFDLPSFVRMIAKIAHGSVWDTYDFDKTTPLLSDIILNGDVSNAGFVIGYAKDPLTEGEGLFRQTGLIQRRDGIWLTYAKIRLFARVCPTYSVIVSYSTERPRCECEGY